MNTQYITGVDAVFYLLGIQQRTKQIQIPAALAYNAFAPMYMQVCVHVGVEGGDETDTITKIIKTWSISVKSTMKENTVGKRLGVLRVLRGLV